MTSKRIRDIDFIFWGKAGGIAAILLLVGGFVEQIRSNTRFREDASPIIIRIDERVGNITEIVTVMAEDIEDLKSANPLIEAEQCALTDGRNEPDKL